VQQRLQQALKGSRRSYNGEQGMIVRDVVSIGINNCANARYTHRSQQLEVICATVVAASTRGEVNVVTMVTRG
jgi:hypothetical protein